MPSPPFQRWITQLMPSLPVIIGFINVKVLYLTVRKSHTSFSNLCVCFPNHRRIGFDDTYQRWRRRWFARKNDHPKEQYRHQWDFLFAWRFGFWLVHTIPLVW